MRRAHRTRCGKSSRGSGLAEAGRGPSRVMLASTNVHPAATMSPRPRLLVAEDDPDIRDILVHTLAADGAREVLAVENGRAALEAVEAQPFDLVILDVLMPELSGLQVLERMRRLPGGRDVPVLVITALDDRDTVVRALRAGADDRLTKPFDPVLLRARVAAALDRKRLRDRERAHLAEIERERQRADELLHAIMPAPAVAELKASDRMVPRRFEDVTLLIADVAGFTAFCDSHPTEEVIRNLEDLIDWFEALAELHGLEKIKTIGDAFMATGNLLLPLADAPLAAVRCAFAMTDAAAHLPVPWTLRTAIHRGPVIAGVLGHSKLAFDLWGDTVNVTARLAAAGLEPGIYLTASTRERLDGRVQTVPIDPVAIKGKGALEVWRCNKLLTS